MTREVAPEHEVVVIGAGFGGIAAAAKLRESGFRDVVVFEEADELGGTWRENTYPGCACDVPSALYSYSFAPNPDWTRMYAGNAEIHDYLRRTADDLGVTGLIRFGTKVESAHWDDLDLTWRLETSAGAVTARWVVAACGPLHRPSMPDIAGIDTFEGTLFHSARWNHEHDLRGRRVAVLGTGASAIQFVPEIQPLVDSLTIFQRTAQWVLPKPDRHVGDRERALYRRLPGAQRVMRRLTHLVFEAGTYGVRHPLVLRPLEWVSTAHMRRHITDPALRRRVTVSTAMGCKRILLSNRWYETLARPNVRVVDGDVRQIRPHSIVDGEGVEYEVDTLILATGYHAASPPVAELFHDGRGRSMSAYFAEGGAQAYLGTTVAGFPNLFLLTGPNSFVYSSIVGVIEAQVDRLVTLLRYARHHTLGSVTVRPEIQRLFNDELQDAIAHTVWASGCSSWFMDDSGRNTTMWPWSTGEMRRRLGDVDPTDFELRPLNLMKDGVRR